jgi:phenylacetate-CoA ligase
MFFQILRCWASLQKSQWFKKQALAQIQDTRLKRIVNHSYRNVPFYNKLYHSHGVDLERIRNASDLSRIPAITRSDLQGESLDVRTASGTDLNSCMLRTSSGTTATPIQVLEDSSSIAYRDALNLRLLWAYGTRPFNSLCKMRVSDPEGEPKVRLSDVGMYGIIRKHGMKSVLYDTDPAKVAAMLAKWKPDIIFGTGSYFRMLAECSRRLNLHLNCRTIITSGEILDSSTRAYLRDEFRANVYDHYGMEEVGGSIAWECPTHSGYHINDECVILEFLRDGEPVAPGEPGEIYITSLTRTSTPIIRYATGDIATRIASECQCGRGLSMIKNVQGRILDFVVTKNGRLVSPASIINKLEDVPGVEQFRVVQNEANMIEIHVKIAAGMDNTTQNQLEHVCTELFDDTPLRIIQVDEVDYSLGQKFRIIESSVTKRRSENLRS